MRNTLKPNDVFVPEKFPIEETNAYAYRGTPQRDTSTALERGYVPLVFGGYGVGKSSMVARIAQDFQPSDAVVYVETVYAKSLDSIFQQVLEKLGYEVTVQNTMSSKEGTTATIGAEVEGGIFQALKAKFKSTLSGNHEDTRTEVSELVVTTPTESKIIDICEQNGLLLIVDELHRASEPLTHDLSAFLKAYANKNCKNFRIALLGTENEASRLVISDPGTDRILEEVPLPPLSTTEAQEVIETGFPRLGIEISDDVRDELVQYSVGSPFVLQFLCLEIAEASYREESRAVTSEDVKESLKTYGRRKAQRLIREYRAAIETTGEKRYRKQILLAMANGEDEYVTMEYLVEKISSALNIDVPATALSGPLRALKNQKYGSILRDVANPAGGGRLANYSGFSDPAMKAIIRMVETAPIPMV
ncbi:AAA family ATPase [Desulfoluna butyratoxydans]|uniref:Aaa+ atpase domain n=1 Tax=Desulfoluna butyratoxydans TaxID=231438 RepID=A0A4U8YLD1_9BACT|nr:AAA family ATPase [Desulfoluna butyratoxydans]VFQ44367.1 aaa+ atpase domain [Desulfoluna butyratoxydans]